MAPCWQFKADFRTFYHADLIAATIVYIINLNTIYSTSTLSVYKGIHLFHDMKIVFYLLCRPHCDCDCPITTKLLQSILWFITQQNGEVSTTVLQNWKFWHLPWWMNHIQHTNQLNIIFDGGSKSILCFLWNRSEHDEKEHSNPMKSQCWNNTGFKGNIWPYDWTVKGQTPVFLKCHN